MNKVRHTFIFETSSEWQPKIPYCWVECPFSFNIKLGQSCRAFNEDFQKLGLGCPFEKLGIIDDEVYDD